MVRKFSLLFVIVFMELGVICVSSQAQDPNASEVLHRYKESYSYLQSVSMRIDIEIILDSNHPNKLLSPSERHLIFRRDHDRAEWIGEYLSFDDKGNVDPLNSGVIKRIMTGELYMDLIDAPLKGPPRGASIARDYKDELKGLLENSGLGGPLFGRINGNNYRSLAEVLGESANLHLRNKQENIGGVPCYVLEAKTKYGKAIVWVAPGKGYNALKWTFEKGPSDLFDKTLVLLEWPETTSIEMFDSVEVQEVSDVFVTTGGCLTHTVNFDDGRKYVSYEKYKVSKVEINPDFETLGAFKIDLPNGTPVFVMEFPGVRYIWQNGKMVPNVDAPTFEEIDKMVDEIKKEKK